MDNVYLPPYRALLQTDKKQEQLRLANYMDCSEIVIDHTVSSDQHGTLPLLLQRPQTIESVHVIEEHRSGPSARALR